MKARTMLHFTDLVLTVMKFVLVMLVEKIV